MALQKGNKGIQIIPNRVGTNEPKIELYQGSTTYTLEVEDNTNDVVIFLNGTEVARMKSSGDERFQIVGDLIIDGDLRDSSGNVIVTQSGIYNGTFQGTTGDRGPQGPQGNQGPKGTKGPKGNFGPTGQKGTKGVAGNKGNKGTKGNNSPKGVIGDNGPRGNDGPQGPQGPQGDKGIKGNLGDKG